MRSTLIQEEWKPVRGYIGLYDASNFGRIRSLDRWVKYGNGRLSLQKGRILKPGKIKKGYLLVGLCKDKNKKLFYVHRLVYEAFNGSIPDGMHVNHINEIKTDNSVWNLNLMTSKDNTNYGTRNQRASEKLKNNPKRSKALLQLTYPGLEFMCEWPSAHEAGRNGFYQSDVVKCCLGKLKSHRDVTFRYKETYSL